MDDSKAEKKKKEKKQKTENDDDDQMQTSTAMDDSTAADFSVSARRKGSETKSKELFVRSSLDASRIFQRKETQETQEEK